MVCDARVLPLTRGLLVRPFPYRSAAALALALLLGACTLPPPLPPGPSTAFGLMGDTPYSSFEALALDRVIDQLNAEDLAFVVHVGDITSGRGPCTDAWFRDRKAQFDRIRHPFILIPGDNDWVDCHRSGMDPMERLQHFRKLFLDGGQSLGQRTIPVERQPAQAGRTAYPEHMRWVAGGVLFVTVNVQGSNDNRGRTPQMDEEHRQRSGAVRDWLDESARRVLEGNLSGMVILMQANPRFGAARPGVDDGAESDTDAYAGLRGQLRQLTGRLARPVMLVHGDTHLYQQNRPLKDAAGRTLEHFVRVEVNGSPFTGWLRGRLHDSRSRPVSVEPADAP
jgi:hypothetical protein